MKLLATMVLIFACSTSVRADTYTFSAPSNWDFSFSTNSAACSLFGLPCGDFEGSGTFSLELITPVETSTPSCARGPWYQIVGMNGQMNGTPISFAPLADPITNCNDELLASHNMQPSQQFQNEFILFSTGSANWGISSRDSGALALYVLLEDSNGTIDSILNWNVVPAAEPSSVILALIGLCSVFLLQYRNTAGQKHN